MTQPLKNRVSSFDPEKLREVLDAARRAKSPKNLAQNAKKDTKEATK